jgi:hypothetical protein
VGIAVFTAAITFGVTRYRAPVDALLPVVAGVGISAWIGRARPTAPDDETSAPAPVTTGP